MSFCKRDADQEELDSISDLDYFCWLGGSALMMVADPLIVYCTALAVLLLVLPPTGIRWRGKEKTS